MADEIEEKVKKIIIEQLEVAPDKVKPEASFTDDLKADSLAVVELVLALEEAVQDRDPRRGHRENQDRRGRHQLHQSAREIDRGHAPQRRKASRMARRVVVTGIGLVTPIAMGTEETWQGLLGRQVRHRSDHALRPHRRSRRTSRARSKTSIPTRWMTSREAKTVDHFIQYAVAAGCAGAWRTRG